MNTATIGGALAVGMLGIGLLVAPTAHAANVCDLGFIPVKPTVGVGSIIATVKVKCDVPPEKHELRLELDMLVRGEGWQTREFEEFEQIPRPTATYQVKAACTPGTWRMQANAVGTLGGQPFDFSDASMPRIVTAEDCARGR